MSSDIFYHCGKWIYTLRWLLVALTIMAVLVSIPILPKVFSSFTTTGFQDDASQSAKTDAFIKENLQYQKNQVVVVYQAKYKFNQKYSNAVKKSLSSLKNYPLKHEIIFPDDNKDQISKDKKTAYAVIAIKDHESLNDKEVKQLKNLIKKPKNMNMMIGGEPIFLNDTNQQTQKDLIRAEYIATPIAVITLLIVFGSVAAALLPIVLDGVCAIFILSILWYAGKQVSLSIFTLNIALLLGLCLSLDYALFIISRFREELQRQTSIQTVIANTQATAGKAIFFSGLAIFASLSALLLFPINVLFSVGIGGMIAVGSAMLVSLIILPAFLGIMKQGINFLPIKIFKSQDNKSFWRWLVQKVVAHPIKFFMAILLLLLILGAPFFYVKLGISDYKILPENMQSRQVFDLFEQKFAEEEMTPIYVMIKSTRNNILSRGNISQIYNFVTKLEKNPKVERISSIVTTTPKLTKKQYQTLYSNKKNHSDEIEQLLKLSTQPDFTVISVISRFPKASEETQDLIDQIREMPINNNLTVAVTGQPVITNDVLETIKRIFPYAFIWIVVSSYIILLLLLRSLFLPIKAILMNILSLFTSYGLLVTIIQRGYFSTLLGFDPQGILDVSLMVIIFCTLFGFSIDYEVFLLSRIKEEYERTGDDINSICFGIVNSSRIITSAAIVVIFICLAFITADIILVKAFGLGIAIAIFVDAFLIRSILVPATMTLMEGWNWYLPKWLDRILPKVTFNPE